VAENFMQVRYAHILVWDIQARTISDAASVGRCMDASLCQHSQVEWVVAKSIISRALCIRKSEVPREATQTDTALHQLFLSMQFTSLDMSTLPLQYVCVHSNYILTSECSFCSVLYITKQPSSN